MAIKLKSFLNKGLISGALGAIVASTLLLGTGAAHAEARTYVPDDVFERHLIWLGLDSGELDDYVPTKNIVNVKSLDLSNLRDLGANWGLEGIDDFKSLESLNLTNVTSLNTLDLGQDFFIFAAY